jgi:hypothetical protein
LQTLIKTLSGCPFKDHRLVKQDQYPEDGNIHYYFSLSAFWSEVREVTFRETSIVAGWLRDESDHLLSFISNTLVAMAFGLEENGFNLQADEAILVINYGKDTLDVLVYEAGVQALEEITEGSRATLSNSASD